MLSNYQPVELQYGLNRVVYGDTNVEVPDDIKLYHMKYVGTLKEIKNLHESMVNAQGFVVMDKPIGRMTSVKKSESKEQATPVNPNQKTYQIGDKGATVNGVTITQDPTTKKIMATTKEGEMIEGKKTTKKKVEKNPFAICTSSLGLEGKKKDEFFMLLQ